MITIIPPAFLFLVYFILGGLALFMYLMGMSTILGFALWLFYVYFNYESDRSLQHHQQEQSNTEFENNNNN
jgi:hypothetical protein